MPKPIETTEELPEIDVHSLPIARIATRTLYQPWSHEELQEKAHEHAKLEREIDGEEEALKAYSKLKKSEIEVLEDERKQLSYALDRGKLTEVDCEVRLDLANNRRFVIRTDTREVVEESTPLVESERQLSFDEITGAVLDKTVEMVNSGALGPNVTARRGK